MQIAGTSLETALRNAIDRQVTHALVHLNVTRELLAELEILKVCSDNTKALKQRNALQVVPQRLVEVVCVHVGCP